MLHQLILVIAIATGGGGTEETAAVADTPREAAPAAAAAAAPAFEAEDQTPTNRFLTATEVRPILGVTRNNWIHVRDFDGQDLVYLTHLLAWRCGLHRIEWNINDGPWQVWPMPPCYVDEQAPGAIKPEDPLPYIAYASGSVETVGIRLLYDDLGTDEGRFGRNGMELQ